MSDVSAPPTQGGQPPVADRFKSVNQSDGNCLIFENGESESRWIESDVHVRLGRMR